MVNLPWRGCKISQLVRPFFVVVVEIQVSVFNRYIMVSRVRCWVRVMYTSVSPECNVYSACLRNVVLQNVFHFIKGRIKYYTMLNQTPPLSLYPRCNIFTPCLCSIPAAVHVQRFPDNKFCTQVINLTVSKLLASKHRFQTSWCSRRCARWFPVLFPAGWSAQRPW